MFQKLVDQGGLALAGLCLDDDHLFGNDLLRQLAVDQAGAQQGLGLVDVWRIEFV